MSNMKLTGCARRFSEWLIMSWGMQNAKQSKHNDTWVKLQTEATSDCTARVV